METNVLYYGDNLDILRSDFPIAAVDLIYLDPPFNSKRDYNVIFKDESGNKSDAQLLAFEDTWHWGPAVESTYQYLTNFARHQGKVSTEVSALIGALRTAIGTNQMMAYLVEMAVRLVELRRVLKSTGSLFLHCDPTASAYLKVVLDAIFGPENFQNEIVWKRTTAHSDSNRAGRIHDVLLFYGPNDGRTWNKVYQPYDQDYVDRYYRYKDPDGRRYASGDVAAAGPGPARYFKGVLREPPPGSHWRFSQEKIDQYVTEGRIFFTANGFPRNKRYLDEMEGIPLQDIWADKAVQPVVSWSKEGAGWATQKPLGLLERIIAAASNEGDIVLDPFCGCGTALIAAQKLGRKWVGIDITYLSIAVMESRLLSWFPTLGHVKVIGQPTEVEGARMLAQQSLHDRYEFQYWALTQIGAQPVGDKKKGADAGIDGRIAFTEAGNEVRFVLVSVKSGNVNVAQVRDLIGTMKREQSPLGVFVTLDEPSAPMTKEAASAGTYWSDIAAREYPAVQIITVKDLLDGKRPELPLLLHPAFHQAETPQISPGQTELFGE
ncbi:MAG TPA: DNA methyltransferase [Dehalococcoidia bacterium]